MALESATYINGLIATNPTGADPVAQADDHIRLIKNVLKTTFPNIDGQVTATPAALNNTVNKNGDTMLGALTLPGAPTANLHAATKQYVDTLASSAALPVGLIVMWSGTVATIPTGWALCNGANGTPDLRNRFIVGSDADTTGQSTSSITGSATKTGGTKDAIVVSHSHTLSDPGHDHGYSVTALAGADGGGGALVGGIQNSSNDGSFSGSTDSSTTGMSISSTGSSGTNQNLPPYFALCFIMKV